jgi:hypothetical protein
VEDDVMKSRKKTKIDKYRGGDEDGAEKSLRRKRIWKKRSRRRRKT